MTLENIIKSIEKTLYNHMRSDFWGEVSFNFNFQNGKIKTKRSRTGFEVVIDEHELVKEK